MKLSIKQIKDYNYCPRMYKYAHVDGIYSGKITTVENFFDDCIKQTVYWFFYNIQDNIVPSIKEVKKKFGDLFVGSRSVGETIFMDRIQRNTARALENKSIDMLKHFHDMYKDNHGIPILVNKDYEIKIGNAMITGTIPIIRENRAQQIEMLSFYTDSKNSKIVLASMIRYDIETTASSLAFKTLFNKIPDKHTYYSLNSSEECNINKSPNQYQDFIEMIESISKAIQLELYHPVYNDNCIGCAYNKLCARI